jgi:hypothetical protein
MGDEHCSVTACHYVRGSLLQATEFTGKFGKVRSSRSHHDRRRRSAPDRRSRHAARSWVRIHDRMQADRYTESITNRMRSASILIRFIRDPVRTASTRIARDLCQLRSLTVQRNTSSIVVVPSMHLLIAAMRSEDTPSWIICCLISADDEPCSTISFKRSRIGMTS